MRLGFSSGGKRRKKERNTQPASYPQLPNYTTPYPPNDHPMPPMQSHQHPPAPYPARPYPATTPPHIPPRSQNNLRETLAAQAGRSVTHLRSKTSQYLDSAQTLNQGAALCDIISSKFDAIITSMDGEKFSGNEQDLWLQDAYEPPYLANRALFPETTRGGQAGNQVYQASAPGKKGSNHFEKVWLYANSRLPPHLPPFKVYLPTWPLVCLAASYSERVYSPERSHSHSTHIPASWRSGTKAMVLKSLPIDSMHTVVFSIRGSATFMDWAVNYKSAPSSPSGFLDDAGNLCHSGFLFVARQMIAPVAERLRALLQENPGRSACSLLITGHSAGGAVAALLYAHMMSEHVHSELSHLTSFFKRVHCVTFGAPPVSLLPLRKPAGKKWSKSLFFGFVNEGDPVPRADKGVVGSLLRLYASPAPNTSCAATLAGVSGWSGSSANVSSTSTATTAMSAQSIWTLPPTTLSTAGRLVVLREKATQPQARRNAHKSEDIEAVTVDDELLRTVVYGDPIMHMMSLYKRRVEILATKAVTLGEY